MQIIPFEDLPSTNTPIDATNLNTMQHNIKSELEDKNGIIILKDIASAAPEECQKDDAYYNVDTALIYKAIGTNTWNTVGEQPSYNYLYLNKKNKSIYYYNGTELENYGGTVTDDLESSSSVNPPSINAVKSALTDIDKAIDALTASLADRDPVVLWRNPNRNVAFGAQTINLSSEDYDYLEIYYWDWSESATKGYWDLQYQKVIKFFNTTLFTVIMYNGKAYMGVRKLVYNSPVKYNAEVCYGIVQDSQFILGTNNVWCIPVIIYGYKANRTG